MRVSQSLHGESLLYHAYEKHLDSTDMSLVHQYYIKNIARIPQTSRIVMFCYDIEEANVPIL